MNFSDFAFWWCLLLLAAGIAAVRGVSLRLGCWPQAGDRLSLAILSCALFYNAAGASFVIFAVEALFTYGMVRWMNRVAGWPSIAIGAATIAVDLSILVYFKYLHFLVGSVLPMSPTATNDWATAMAVVGMIGIPPGISFYTFQKVAYVIDSRRADQQADPKPLDFINFAAFFPQIVAGPIERRQDLLPQIERFRWRVEAGDLENGMRWIVLGMFMKLALADNLAPHIAYTDAANPWVIIIATTLFGLRIYFDFAGYSLIALGIARVFGIKLTLNFLSPYAASNIQEFWRRWHVTLSGWFRDYLYKPLGGSKVVWWGLNILAVFIVSGLWHGAGWNFIAWGAFHGLLLLGYQLVGRHVPLPRFVAWTVTLAAVMAGWLFFMETDVDRLASKVATLVTPAAYSVESLRLATTLAGSAMLTLALVVGFLVLEIWSLWRDPTQPYRWFVTPKASKALLVLVVLLCARESNGFIYFAF